MTTTAPTPISYTALLTKMQGETENTSLELAAQFPQIVRDAELLLLRALDIQNLHVYADANFSSNNTVGLNAYLALPLDCEVVRYLQYFIPANNGFPSSTDVTDQYSGTAVQLLQVDESLIQNYWPNKSVTGLPLKYAILGSSKDQSAPAGQLLVAPTPDKPYALRIAYTSRPTSLADLDPNTGVTYLATWYPDVLFYAVMFRAAEFMKNLDQAKLWQSHLQISLTDAQKLEARKKGQSYADKSQTAQPLQQWNQ